MSETHSALYALRQADIPARYTRFSALDRFFRKEPAPLLTLSVSCGLIDLAKIFPALRYPGIDGADAALAPAGEEEVYFSCNEAEETPAARGENFAVLSLLYDPFRDSFYDPGGVYPLLRSKALAPEPGSPEKAVAVDAAVLVSRYAYRLKSPAAIPPFSAKDTPPETQRALLAYILSGQNAADGLRLLAGCGFIDALWPELACLRSIAHSKEYHPEGDVWEHTLETFGYRKGVELPLALALLLHDAGKPHAAAQEGRRFDKHAEIGARVAENFLARLGFPPSLITDVAFLIRNHMLPGLIKTLPTHRTEDVMASPLFPLLLEVYRCDLSSTFRGPDGYYEACKVYRAFLKNRKNPYRTINGKKVKRLNEYVEKERSGGGGAAFAFLHYKSSL
ncbi:MAG: HD domain-containing protein [Spirochaetaceae bacterium]|nr:HD domain-containing protein [Spirochaetaceae bacterium]